MRSENRLPPAWRANTLVNALIGANPLFGFSVVLAAVIFFFVGSHLVGAGALGAYLRREL